MSTEAREFYEKYAPRWFKVMRWRDIARRFVETQKMAFLPIYVGGYIWWASAADPYVKALFIQRPTTDEERMKLKAQYYDNIYARDYGIDQYQDQVQPHYDVFKRRQQYPEHYGNKYNRYKMYED